MRLQGATAPVTQWMCDPDGDTNLTVRTTRFPTRHTHHGTGCTYAAATTTPQPARSRPYAGAASPCRGTIAAVRPIGAGQGLVAHCRRSLPVHGQECDQWARA